MTPELLRPPPVQNVTLSNILLNTIYMKPTLLFTVMFMAVCAFGKPGPNTSGRHARNWSDSMQMKKLIVIKNAVRLSPNPSYDGSVSVASNLAETLHFYIFDLDGTLIYQAVLK